MPAMLKANERCYERTFGLYHYGLEALNHRSELKILWDTFRRRIANDRRIAGDREVCFHMIADDRRTFCDLRSAIVCDHMERMSDISPVGRNVRIPMETQPMETSLYAIVVSLTQKLLKLILPSRPLERSDHNTGNSVPYSLRRVCDVP